MLELDSSFCNLPGWLAAFPAPSLHRLCTLQAHAGPRGLPVVKLSPHIAISIVGNLACSTSILWVLAGTYPAEALEGRCTDLGSGKSCPRCWAACHPRSKHPPPGRRRSLHPWRTQHQPCRKHRSLLPEGSIDAGLLYARSSSAVGLTTRRKARRAPSPARQPQQLGFATACASVWSEDCLGVDLRAERQQQLLI